MRGILKRSVPVVEEYVDLEERLRPYEPSAVQEPKGSAETIDLSLDPVA